MMSQTAAEFDVHNASMRIVHIRNLRHVDWLLPITVLLLAGIGWATLYSANRIGDEYLYFHRQILFFFMGLGITLTVICIDYRFLVSLSPLMFCAAVGLLVYTLVLGKIGKGSERWIDIGLPFTLQPSEPTKLVMVYSLTWYLTRIGGKIRKLPWFLLIFILMGIPMLLILRQPDLGTAGSLVPLVVVMLFVAGARIRHLLVVILLGLSVVPLVWWQMGDYDPKIKPPAAEKSLFELSHYQKGRIYTFLHPESNIEGGGWQTYQSKITIGSGGLSGKGYLQGTQTRLNYLPEHHTDLIFSLLAEEKGFIGVVCVIGLFLALLLRGLIYARDCPDMMGTLLASGTVTILAFHIFVNIAITSGLLPVTGLPLPFLSYGGSFYLTTMAAVGILLNVPMRRRMFVN
jgi:rod shape determining protein RodA